MRVLLTGATGFIGSALAPRLVADGHEVRAMTRSPAAYSGLGDAVYGDTADHDSLVAAMSGCAVAYYLVHGLDGPGRVGDRDAEAARGFGRAAAQADIEQIVYLGGLGRQGDDLSEHLASRQEVEGRLAQTGVPVTTFRAALVIGAGSASFELLRQVVARLPVLLIPPEASRTRVQPIALADMLRYLLAVLGVPELRNRTFEVGGPDILTYEQMLRQLARRLGRRAPALPLLPVPRVLTSVALGLVTDVDRRLAVTLLDSLGNDVVVTDDTASRLLPGPLATFTEMLDDALESSRQS